MLTPALFPLLALATFVAAEPLHVPLVRRAPRPSTADLDHFSKAADRLRGKYGVGSSSRKRAGQTVGVAMTNSVSRQTIRDCRTVAKPRRMLVQLCEWDEGDVPVPAASVGCVQVDFSSRYYAEPLHFPDVIGSWSLWPAVRLSGNCCMTAVGGIHRYNAPWTS